MCLPFLPCVNSGASGDRRFHSLLEYNDAGCRCEEGLVQPWCGFFFLLSSCSRKPMSQPPPRAQSCVTTTNNKQRDVPCIMSTMDRSSMSGDGSFQSHFKRHGGRVLELGKKRLGGYLDVNALRKSIRSPQLFAGVSTRASSGEAGDALARPPWGVPSAGSVERRVRRNLRFFAGNYALIAAAMLLVSPVDRPPNSFFMCCAILLRRFPPTWRSSN